MSCKSNITAAFAAALVAAVIGCDSDAVSPDPDPISVAGVYNYTFDFTNGEEGEISCEGEGGSRSHSSRTPRLAAKRPKAVS